MRPQSELSYSLNLRSVRQIAPEPLGDITILMSKPLQIGQQFEAIMEIIRLSADD
jgi:hypothetical protein